MSKGRWCHGCSVFCLNAVFIASKPASTAANMPPMTADQQPGKVFAVDQSGAILGQRLEQEEVLAVEEFLKQSNDLASVARVQA